MLWTNVASAVFIVSVLLFIRELTVMCNYSLKSFQTNHGNQSRFASFYRIHFPNQNASSFLEEYVARTLPFGSFRSSSRIPHVNPEEKQYATREERSRRSCEEETEAQCV